MPQTPPDNYMITLAKALLQQHPQEILTLLAGTPKGGVKRSNVVGQKPPGVASALIEALLQLKYRKGTEPQGGSILQGLYNPLLDYIALSGSAGPAAISHEFGHRFFSKDRAANAIRERLGLAQKGTQRGADAFADAVLFLQGKEDLPLGKDATFLATILAQRLVNALGNTTQNR